MHICLIMNLCFTFKGLKSSKEYEFYTYFVSFKKKIYHAIVNALLKDIVTNRI